MARRVKKRGTGLSRLGAKVGWPGWITGLTLAAAMAFVAGIGVGVMLGDHGDVDQAKMPRIVPPVKPTMTVSKPAPATSKTTLLRAPANMPKTARIIQAPAVNRLVEQTWANNAVAYTVAPGTPLIAIVLDDMGLNRRRSERATRLPGPLTLSYLSYADNLMAQTGAARARGHELMLHLPMEPEGDADPGPGALLVRLSDMELRERIDFALGRFPGFVAVNNHMGSRFTADRARMRLVFDAMRKTGHLFLDSLTTPNAVAMSLGPETGVPTIARDVFLDDVDSQDEVWFRLLKAEQIAEAQGTAIAIGHPRDATLAVLEDWIAELPSRSARLAPISAVARIRLGRRLQVMAKP
jgi:uncharacterized protein